MENNNEELEKLKITASINIQKWTITKDVIFLIIKACTVIACIYIIMTNLVAMSDKNPDTLDSLAKIVESLKISEIILYIVTITSLGYGYFERKGKKRAIEKMAQYQYQLEKNDPFRGTSFLTSQGDSPTSKKSNKRARK